jgi:hypothetical protein
MPINTTTLLTEQGHLTLHGAGRGAWYGLV